MLNSLDLSSKIFSGRGDAQQATRGLPPGDSRGRCKGQHGGCSSGPKRPGGGRLGFKTGRSVGHWVRRVNAE